MHELLVEQSALPEVPLVRGQHLHRERLELEKEGLDTLPSPPLHSGPESRTAVGPLDPLRAGVELDQLELVQ